MWSGFQGRDAHGIPSEPQQTVRQLLWDKTQTGHGYTDHDTVPKLVVSHSHIMVRRMVG